MPAKASGRTDRPASCSRPGGACRRGPTRTSRRPGPGSGGAGERRRERRRVATVSARALIMRAPARGSSPRRYEAPARGVRHRPAAGAARSAPRHRVGGSDVPARPSASRDVTASNSRRGRHRSALSRTAHTWGRPYAGSRVRVAPRGLSYPNGRMGAVTAQARPWTPPSAAGRSPPPCGCPVPSR
jgi:hypothetical protein